jgi:hypothetical protein
MITVKTVETSPAGLAELMVGRKVLLEVIKKPATPGAVVWMSKTRVVDGAALNGSKSISFQIRAGEILGIAVSPETAVRVSKSPAVWIAARLHCDATWPAHRHHFGRESDTP